MLKIHSPKSNNKNPLLLYNCQITQMVSFLFFTACKRIIEALYFLTIIKKSGWDAN